MPRAFLLVVLLSMVSACAAFPRLGGQAAPEGVPPQPEPAVTGIIQGTAQAGAPVLAEDLPPMRWQDVPGSDAWTRASLKALSSHGAPLLTLVPADSEAWCPAYPEQPAAQRALFWTGLLSALSKHESTWRPEAVGGGDKWYGLVQIAPATARGYGCAAQSGTALKNGPANLSCAIRIMTATVGRDGVVSAGSRGVAADWGPFHSPRKLGDMKAWSRSQPWCRKAG